MKNNWPVKKLGEIAKIYQPKTITSTEIKEQGQYKVFGANGVIGYYDKYNHENPEVLITCRGATCGTINYSEPNSWITGNSMVVHPIDENQLSKDYLYYSLQVLPVETTISGTAQPQITRSQLEPLTVPLPNIETQNMIVEKLDAVRKAQKLIDLQIQKTEELFESLLKNEINSSGVKGQLSDFTRLVTYGFTSPMPVAESGPFMITARDINDGEIKYKTCRKTSFEAYKQLSNKSKPELEDILLTKDGTLGRIALVTEIPLCINQSVALIKPEKSKVMSKFLKYLLESSEYQREMLRNAGGATIKHIYITIVDKMGISVPDIKKQKEIIEKLDAIQDYKKLLQKQKQLYEELFDSVLYKSMKGEMN